ncbi:diacylglyceryl transferase [Chitinophaga silvatica]|uniref:Diacylglyceryl transferase n=1 Tax=Chitinophaga silvatica TaxID=2282649 RepID=A0A3E1Y319_9BACT|nr:prolipoprotein diacylglyceryl transferase family protein [Chitinophaga silvatica]RFS19026.1 diacylglyceryl transferase [Chitinophaga silvatica]
MHFPVYIDVLSLHFPLHALTETLGMFLGFRYFLFLRKQQGDLITNNNRIWIIIGATFGALAGSRILGALENPLALYHSDNPLLYTYLNKTIVGGLIGGLIGVELMKKVVKEKTSSGDLFVYPLIFAMIIGRIGCFSMGVHEETYGIPSALPWAMDLGDGQLRHPVALYEIIYLLILWFILSLVSRKCNLENGAKFKLFMIGYLLFRLLLDFIKPGYRYLFGLGSIQLACIAGLLYYSRDILFPSRLIQKQYA